MIALTDGSSDGNIVWSWHIWVTNQDWNSKTVTLKDEEGHTYEMAPSVLGRCDNSPGTPARNLQLRVRFDLKDANGNSITGTKVVSEGRSTTFSKRLDRSIWRHRWAATILIINGDARTLCPEEDTE